jgi:hypothetical protein
MHILARPMGQLGSVHVCTGLVVAGDVARGGVGAGGCG